MSFGAPYHHYDLGEEDVDYHRKGTAPDHSVDFYPWVVNDSGLSYVVTSQIHNLRSKKEKRQHENMSNFCRMFANLDISHSDSPKNVYILTQNRKRRHKLFFQFRPKSNDTIYHIFTKNICNLKFKWCSVVTWFSSSNHRPVMAWRDWLINEIQRFVFAPWHLHQTVGSLGWLLRAIENKSVIDGGMTDALKTRRNDFKFKTDFVLPTLC